MINEIYSHVKPSNTKAKRLFILLMGLSALLAAGAVALNIFGGPYKGVVAFCGCISIVAAVFIYTKYIGVEYYYDVTFDSEGTAVFVVRQVTGKRESTLCRIDLWSITKIEKLTAKERSAHKAQAGFKRYFYLPTLSPDSVILITIRSEYENAEIVIEANDEFASMLKGYAREARESRFDGEEY